MTEDNSSMGTSQLLEQGREPIPPFSRNVYIAHSLNCAPLVAGSDNSLCKILEEKFKIKCYPRNLEGDDSSIKVRVDEGVWNSEKCLILMTTCYNKEYTCNNAEPDTISHYETQVIKDKAGRLSRDAVIVIWLDGLVPTAEFNQYTNICPTNCNDLRSFCKSEQYLAVLARAINRAPNASLTCLPKANVGYGAATGFFYGYLRLVLPDFCKRFRNAALRDPAAIPDMLDRSVRKMLIILPLSCFCSTSIEDNGLEFVKGFYVKRWANRAGNVMRDYKSSVFKLTDRENNEVYYFAGELATPLLTMYESYFYGLVGMTEQQLFRERDVFCFTVHQVLQHPENRECNDQYRMITWDDRKDSDNKMKETLYDRLKPILKEELKKARKPGEKRPKPNVGYIAATDFINGYLRRVLPDCFEKFRDAAQSDERAIPGMFARCLRKIVIILPLSCFGETAIQGNGLECPKGFNVKRSVDGADSVIQDKQGFVYKLTDQANADVYYFAGDLATPLLTLYESYIDRILNMTEEQLYRECAVFCFTVHYLLQLQQHRECNDQFRVITWDDRKDSNGQLKETLYDVLLPVLREELEKDNYLRNRNQSDDPANEMNRLRLTNRQTQDTPPNASLTCLPKANVGYGAAIVFIYEYLRLVLPDFCKRFRYAALRDPIARPGMLDRSVRKMLIILPLSCSCPTSIQDNDIECVTDLYVKRWVTSADNRMRDYKSSVFKLTDRATNEVYYFAGELPTSLLTMYESYMNGLIGMTPEQLDKEREDFNNTVQKVLESAENKECKDQYRVITWDDRKNTNGQFKETLYDKLLPVLREELEKETQTDLPKTNVGYEAAIEYFDQYLRLVLPNFCERFEDAALDDPKAIEGMLAKSVLKMLIILPRSCSSTTAIQDTGIECVTDLYVKQRANRAGSVMQDCKSSVFKLTDKATKQVYYFACELPTPILMKIASYKNRITGMTPEQLGRELMFAVDDFFFIIQEILQQPENREYKDQFRMITWDDQKDTNGQFKETLYDVLLPVLREEFEKESASTENETAKPIRLDTTDFVNPVLENMTEVYERRLFDSYVIGDGPGVRGKALIISIVEFRNPSYSSGTDLQPRPGGEQDGETMTKLFKDLGFEVDKHDNVNRKRLESILSMYNSMDHSNYDAFICCIMTHGNLGAIYTSDCLPYRILDIVDMFSSANCPSLTGKPKIFFVQSCQKGTEQESPFIRGGLQGDCVNSARLDADADADNSNVTQVNAIIEKKAILVPGEPDILMSYSALPGSISYRDPHRGSLYIDALAKNLRKDWDIQKGLTQVTKDVQTKITEYAKDQHTPYSHQVPFFLTTGMSKLLYLRPIKRE